LKRASKGVLWGSWGGKKKGGGVCRKKANEDETCPLVLVICKNMLEGGDSGGEI